MLERLALALLRRFIIAGDLTMTTPTGRHERLAGAGDGPIAKIQIHDRRTLIRLVIQPDLEFGDAYMDGRLTVGKAGLEPLIELLLVNSTSWKQHWAGRLTLRLGNILAWLRHLNPPGRSRHNVAHHYDLTDGLFETFLDPWRQYSCAYFHSDHDTLEDAQVTKLARLAAKLNLQAGDRVLDIGCGWGGLARALIRCREGVSVTGITLSEQQLVHAEQHQIDGDQAGRLAFALRDYRRQTGQFDRIVSVGMLEHVGPSNIPTYFSTVRRLLAPGGVAVIHSIAVHNRSGPVNRWMGRYIFPGGYLPSVRQLVSAAEAQGLKILDMEIMQGHYAETLRPWRARFMAQRRRITELYDDRFVRMWEFYLVGCEYFFRCQHGMVVQLQLSDDHQAVPKSRVYISGLEQTFRDKLCQNAPSGKKNASAR